MLQKILNIGILKVNHDNLNRKIRVSNLICFFTIVIMLGYIPVAVHFSMLGIIILNTVFLAVSILSFYLHIYKKHHTAFYITCTYGLVYFICGPIFYGLASNLQLFILIMCLIAIALFESNIALRIYIVTAVISFFSLLMYLRNRPGLIEFTADMQEAQNIIGTLNLVILFFITILFFIFFRSENLVFQKEILEQKEIIELKQKEILDSINYAKRIQFSLLAGNKLLEQHLPEHFVLFNPKDVVSGDFYWAAPVDGGFMYITADCTGHGVPGAFMSLLNISLLSRVINENKVTRPDLILNTLRTEIDKALNSEDGIEESKDGMDAVLCKLDLTNMQLEYAAANNSFYIIRDNALIICRADKMPVGKGHDDSISFTYNRVALQKGDLIYTLTDGYADQFGGIKGKKFRYKQLEEMLLSVHHLPMKEQLKLLNKTFIDWRGRLEQVDDVLIIGIRV